MRVAVIGGGVAGLTAALALRERGHHVEVFERERTAGGKVGSERHDGWQVERGPAAILDNAPATRRLVERLGLAGAVVRSDEAARRRYILRRGRLMEVPDSPPKLLLSRTLTLGEKWRLANELRAPAPPAGVDETVAEFGRRRLGESLAEHFLEPFVSGVFAGDWRRLSLASAFPRLHALEAEHGSLLRGLIAEGRARRERGEAGPASLTTFTHGLAALPGALARALGDALQTGAAVEALERTPGGLYRLRVGGAWREADRVVLAVPPDDAARLAGPVDAEIGDAFAAIPIAGVAAVSLGYRRADVGHNLDGFGFLAPRKEGERLLGVIWMSSTFPDAGVAPPGHVLLRCMIGGTTDPEAVTLDDPALVALATDGVRRLLSATAAPVFTHVMRWPRAIAQYEVGHAGRVAAISARGEPVGLYVCGAALRGVGVNDVVRDAEEVAARFA